MNKIILKTTVLFSTSLSLILTSCNKEPKQDGVIGTVDNTTISMTPEITWGSFAEGSVDNGFEGAMKVFWGALHQNVFIVTHPDSTSIGIIPFDDPTAKIFREKMFPQHPTKYIVFSTPDSAQYIDWQMGQEKAGCIVVSWFDPQDGRYYGVSYTPEEWKKIYGKKND